jgi:hypothetical protein
MTDFPRHQLQSGYTTLPARVRPNKQKDSMSAEMWEDCRLFKAAGLLHEWLKKRAAYLPEHD